MSMHIGFDGKRIFQNSTGLGNYSRTLLRNLVRFSPEHQYTIFAHQAYLKNTVFDNSFFKTRTSFVQGGNPNTWRAKGIVKDLRQQQIQLYHGLSNELPVGMPSGIKSVVTIHDLIFMRYPKHFPFFDRMVFKAKVKKACQKADKIIAISESTKEDLIELLKIPEEKIQVCYQTWGQEYEHVYTYEVIDKKRKEFHLPEDFLLFVGTGNPRKNIETVLKALSLPENQDVPLVIIGSHGIDAIRKLGVKWQLSHRLFFLEHILWYDIPCIYAMAKGLIYPSQYEGFGLPVLEAQKMGISVITSDKGGLKEVAGEGCSMVDPGNMEQIANAINLMFQNDEDLIEKRNKNSEFIKKFEPLHQTKKIMELYSSLL